MNEGNLFPAETQGVSQDGMLVIEQFLMANYRFRRNILNGKVEFAELPKADNKAEGNTVEDVDSLSLASENEAELEYRALTTPALNTIIIKAKREQVMEKGSPKTEITEYVSSEEVPEYNPVQQFLNNLPTWDGQNHIAKVFGRLPGITTGCRWTCCTETSAYPRSSELRAVARPPLCVGCCLGICASTTWTT